MRIIITAALTWLVSIAGNAQSTAAVLPDQLITFTIVNAGMTVEGTIKVLKGEIILDPRNVNRSHIFAQADAATITTGISIRDKHLKRSDYFDVSAFPLISMRSTKLLFRGSELRATFDLTIKDVTKPVEVVCRRLKNGKYIKYEGSFKINRLDFKLGEESAILDEIVSIQFSLSTQE